MNESILPSTDRRLPFYMEVPPHDAKPIDHLVNYFKVWKHFVAALVAYLKDLVMAKEFELNLNLQLIGSAQFPGFRDLPYRCLSEIEQQLSGQAPAQQAAPKPDGKGLALAPTHSNTVDGKRPGLPKTKSASLFFKNQTFAHRRTGSSSTLASDSSTSPSAPLKVPAPKTATPAKSPTGTKFPGSTTSPPASILAALLAPKLDISIDSTYFPPNSMVMNMGQCVVNHHFNAFNSQARLCREMQKVIGKLENLQKNLSIKIKEIKSSLKNESFANPTLVKEVSKTGAVLNTFILAVHKYSSDKPFIRQSQEDEEDVAILNDPFLTKLRLDYQLKTQLIHENYIFASYVNLQSISRDLLNYVVKELTAANEKLIRATSTEAVYASSLENCAVNLGVTLKSKLQLLQYEWQYFMSHNPHFLNIYDSTENSPKRMTRSFKDVVIPHANSVHSKCLRCGYMYKKQKLLKSYVSSFYLLTANFLHEFRVDDKNSDKKSTSPPNKKKTKGKVGGVVGHDDTPTKSYNLNDYKILVKNDKEFKFVLTKVSNGSQKFTFKCNGEADFINWTTDLYDLLKFGSHHKKRFQFIEEKLAARDRAEQAATPQSDVNLDDNNGMQLNLSSLLSSKLSMNKIQPQSLNGIFTPKVQSPSEQNKNPFETGFVEGIASAAPAAASPGSPLSETDLVSSTTKSPGSPESPGAVAEPTSPHQDEHESYLRLQNEIMAQQQKLMEIQNTTANLAKPLSRNSSNESMVSVLEQNNKDLSMFLNRNKNLMNHDHKGAEFALSTDSLALVPTVYVLNHESG